MTATDHPPATLLTTPRSARCAGGCPAPAKLPCRFRWPVSLGRAGLRCVELGPDSPDGRTPTGGPEQEPLPVAREPFGYERRQNSGSTAARRPDSREARGFAPACRGSYLHRALGGRCATPPASPRSSYPLRAGRPAGVRGSSATTATTRRSPGVASRPASAGSPSRPRHEQTERLGRDGCQGRLGGVEAALRGATPRRLPEHQRAEAALKGHEIGSTRI